MSNQGSRLGEHDDFFDANAFGDSFDPDTIGTNDPTPTPQRMPVQRPAAEPQQELKLARDPRKPERAAPEQGLVKGLDLDQITAPRRQDEPGDQEPAVQQAQFVDPELLTIESDERREAIATWLLLAMIGFIAFSGWVAWKNDGVVDFKDLGSAVGVAVGKMPPTHEETTLNAQPSSLAPEAPEGPAATELELRDLELAHIRPADGVELWVVEGHVMNSDQISWRRIEVEVVGKDAAGETHYARRIPAGTVFSRPELAVLRSEGSVEAAYTDMRRRVAELEVSPGQQTRFSAVFTPGEVPDARTLTWTASAVAGEARVQDSCWVGATDPDALAQAGQDPHATGSEEPAEQLAEPEDAP